MKLAQRRLIYSFFIILFLMGLPIIFLYANGYKYNFKKHCLQKTGIIFLETKPNQAKIFLNNQLVGEHTPLRIKNLLPNTYELKINKSGYNDWIKKIQVSAGETTFIQYVRLFKTNGEINNLYNGKLFLMDYQANKQLFLLKQVNNQIQKIILFNFINKTAHEIFKTTKSISKINLIENGKTVLLESNNKIWLIDSQTGEQKEISTLLKTQKLILDSNNIKINKYNSQYLYFLKNKGLYSYNRFNHQINKWLDYRPEDYWIENNILFCLAHKNLNKISLIKLDLNTQQKEETLLNIDPNKPYILRGIHNNYIMIQNKINKNLILFNQLTKKTTTLKNVNYFKWDQGQNELLYGNQHEIWIFKPTEKEKFVLLTRSAKIIKQATWYSVPTHIVYLVGNQIKIIENLNNNRQTVDILKLKQINQIAVGKRGNKIYFIGQTGFKNGLFEIKIQNLSD